MLNVVILSVIDGHCCEIKLGVNSALSCFYCYAEYHSSSAFFTVMLYAVLLCAVMLCVVMLCVVMLFNVVL
jgi:hypothetical protein